MSVRLGMKPGTASHFWKTLFGALTKNPKSVRYAGSMIALYLHFGPFAKYVSTKIREAIALEEKNPSRVAPPPPPVAVKVAAASG
jgi:hypothetical protein